MNVDKFFNYLKNLSYSEKEISGSLKDNVFVHSIGTGSSLSVSYILTPDVEDIFLSHKNLWNKNSDAVFIAVSKEKSYIINAKEKPDPKNILKKSVCIQSFDYGINSIEFKQGDLEIISKSYIDSTYFFDFISKNQRKGQEVDKDLFLNLLALKNDLTKKGNEKIIHLLILRCLFVKYLEDRGIFKKDYLINILKSKDPGELIKAFDEICKINGDVFKFDKFTSSDIKVSYLTNLVRFFESDYRSGQGTFFPYEFDQIPVQLISHVYEAFLKTNTKKGRGIYYTPSFLVNFMLTQTLQEKIKRNSRIKVLDPAVGSGAFLVESFKIIAKSYGDFIDFDTKKKILEEQLFGIDIDHNALQIAAFSLYLVLLETESPEFIRNEIKHAHPILPNLIGKTLIHGNALTQPIFENDKFDCIVSNPPWGSVPNNNNIDSIEERVAIENNKGLFPEYNNVADFERSQAFLMRVASWGTDQTLYSMVVKNSIFLNDGAKKFREDLLNKYQINTFYELSHYNKILFKKREIGEIEGEKIEIGASEPCVVLIFKNFKKLELPIVYISPKLTEFAEHFNVIQYSQRDKSEINQNIFIENDLLWKILVKGDLEDLDLIKKLLAPNYEEDIMCSRGFEASQNMERISNKTNYRTLIKSEDFDRYRIKNKLSKFDWNQKLHRRREETLYQGDRILIAYRPNRKDNIRLRCIQVKEDIVFRNDILCFKVKGVNNHNSYLALLNSSLLGYFIYHVSSQWDGGLKREALRTYDIKAFNYPKVIDADKNNELVKLISKINKAQNLPAILDLEKKIDETIFANSDLIDYEKEIIQEFYQIRVERTGSINSRVRSNDIIHYFEAFKKSFSLILSSNNTLNATFYISPNAGAIICISIVDDSDSTELKENSNLQILNFVKSKQFKKADTIKILNEDKVKIYDNDQFYIIKSNNIKDWTKRQAIKDAKEEIQQFLKHLSSNQ